MLTHELKIPDKSKELPHGWTIRRLLSLGSGSVAKVVTAFSPFEFMFFIMILISGFAELIGRSVSWMWYVFVLLVLAVAFVQRWHQIIQDKPNKKKPQKNKKE